MTRLPTYFISHGGGPWPWIKDQMPGDMNALEASLQEIPQHFDGPPRAVLAVSGHWEAPDFTVQTSAHPSMLYDYGGFPEFTYHLDYPAPGAPDVAEQVIRLLDSAGIESRRDARRGFDHGVFTPFFVTYPKADVPILQLSLHQGYDPAMHLAVGRALAPLRDEGVLIVGSGLSYHNLGRFGPDGRLASAEFDSWLTETLVGSDPDERLERLERWDRAPSARASHPAEDHLLPLMVAVGAAHDDPAVRFYHEPDFMGSISTSSFRFDSIPEDLGR